MTKPWIALLLLLPAFASLGAAQDSSTQDKRTILAVFAHPDDESTVGAALAKYAAAGHEVYLAILTSGQAGNANTDIPKGPKLGQAREAEARCAAKALGIHEPLLLGFQDGATTSAQTQNEIARKLVEIFDQVRPDVVITWGPDGLTGHPDHRVASNLATQVFQDPAQLQAHPGKLYYVAWPAELAPKGMRAVDERYITTTIDAGDYRDPAAAAIRCHKTQWSPERMDQMIGMGKDLLGGKIRLRLALSNSANPAHEDDILTDLRR